jgi:hypothetical protein
MKLAPILWLAGALAASPAFPADYGTRRRSQGHA